jgi:NAD dependent epimerase/dehydratase family enzyme
MRVFVTGATGFVGRALIPRLQRDLHAVVAWVRSPTRARGLLGADVELVHADTAPDGLVAAIERSDAVVNLAGEPLMGGRWTAARRAVLEGSRIAVTEQLVRAMAEAKSRPGVFNSGSAVGYYGDRSDELLTEAASSADDFLACLCSGSSGSRSAFQRWTRRSRTLSAAEPSRSRRRSRAPQEPARLATSCGPGR